MFDSLVAAAADAGGGATGVCAWTRVESAACARRVFGMVDLLETYRAADPHGSRDQWCLDNWAAVCAQLGAGLRVTSGTVSRYLMVGIVLRERYPQISALFWTGQITYPMVAAIVTRTSLVTDPTVSAHLDAVLAEQILGWAPMSIDRMQKRIDALLEDLDPAAVHRTHTTARSRGVELRPTIGSGIAELFITLFAPDAEAFYRRVSAVAVTVCPADPRTLEQRRADAVGVLAAGADRLTCLCDTGECPAGAVPPPSNVTVYVVARHDTLTPPDTLEPPPAGPPTPPPGPPPPAPPRSEGPTPGRQADPPDEDSGQSRTDEESAHSNADEDSGRSTMAEASGPPSQGSDDGTASPESADGLDGDEDVDGLHGAEPSVSGHPGPATDTAATNAPFTGNEPTDTATSDGAATGSAGPAATPKTPTTPEPPEPPEPATVPTVDPATECAGLDGSTPRPPIPLREMTLTQALAPDPGALSGLSPGYLMSGVVLPGSVSRRAALNATLVPILHPGQAPPEHRYTPSKKLADFIRTRDLTCRFPGCPHPATDADIDHTVPYPYGPTCASNLKCLCRLHHLLKTFWSGPGGWRDEQRPDGTVIWTAPDGTTHLTRPGSHTLFPELCMPTAPVHLPGTPPPAPTKGRAMPTRRRTRRHDRTQRIHHERQHNTHLIAQEAQVKADARDRRHRAKDDQETKPPQAQGNSDTGDPPPF